MKILLAVDVYKPFVNGVVISTANLYEELKKRGHEVRILTLSNTRETFDRDGEYYIGSFPVKIYPNARLTVKPYPHYVREMIHWRPDVVHSQSEFAAFLYAHHIAASVRAPLIHTYHTMYEDYTHYLLPSKRIGKRAAAGLSRYVLNRADEVIVPTRKVLEVLQGYGVRREIVEIPTGIHTEQFDQPFPQEEKNRLREKLGIGPADRVLVTVGRLGKEKNLDEVIGLMRILAEEAAGVKLLIVGDGPARSALEKLAAEQCPPGTVIFAGMVPPEEVHKYYRIGDVFVSASTSETQGLTYIEAMASGLPLVCRMDPCLKGVVEDGVNGYTFQDTRGFSECLMKVLRDPAAFERMREDARSASRRFSVGAFGESVENLYEKVRRRKDGERSQNRK